MAEKGTKIPAGPGPGGLLPGNYVLSLANKKISDKLYYKTSKQHTPGGQVIQNLIDKRTSKLWMQREYNHCLIPSGFNGLTLTNNLMMTQTPTPTPNTNTINIKNFVP